MRVFVTGHQGFIGPHLIEILKSKGHFVTGCDINLFGDCKISEVVKPDIELEKDIRNVTVEDLYGYDCVMHLAAISNDPMGNFDPELTYSINKEGSINIGALAKKAGVKKFLFSSSCSIYGKGESLDLDENASFNPLTAYAISKIETEKAVSNMADENFCPVFLRNSTAYGYSPMFRIDLVVNNFLACAVAKGDIKIMSDGEPWRPLVHCRDIARAFVAVAEAPTETVFNKAINIGGNKENYQVKEVAKFVQDLMPEANIVFTGEVGNDPRDYRVNFDLLYKLLPGFELEYTLKKGMSELYGYLKKSNFSAKDFDGDRFVRMKLLKNNLHKITTPDEV
ncbi:MAG: NAD-dependent epimerase/dehydratase family protein [Bacteroidota bacterium]|nr:NAD-dependent epimerase/dehydratase family protein [Bacteroidota bacterium]